jgi:hypothetical protein
LFRWWTVIMAVGAEGNVRLSAMASRLAFRDAARSCLSHPLRSLPQSAQHLSRIAAVCSAYGRHGWANSETERIGPLITACFGFEPLSAAGGKSHRR